MVDFLDRVNPEISEEVARLAVAAIVKWDNVNRNMRALLEAEIPGTIYPTKVGYWWEDEKK